MSTARCAAAARLRVAASRRAGQGSAVRGAVHSLAVVEAAADSRQHPRQRRAPPSRHARLRRAARARARRRQRAAREDLLAVVRLIEQLHPGVGAAIMLLDADAGQLSLAAASGCRAGRHGVARRICRSACDPARAAPRRRSAGKSSCATSPATRSGRSSRASPSRTACAPAARRRSSPRATASTARLSCTSTPCAARTPKSSISSRA